MKILLIVPFIGMVLAAPVAEDENSIRPIVKRTMETLVFGNQQNNPKQVKKSDPSVSLRDHLPDVEGPVLPDVDGTVKASEAIDIPETKPDSLDDKAEDELEVVGNALKEKDEESDESIENLPETEDKSQSSEEDMVIPPEDAEAIQELEKNVGDEKQDITNIQSNDNDDKYSQDVSYDNPYDIYELYKQYQNMLSEYPRSNMGYYDILSRRRRAITKRRFMGKLNERAVKRTHRIKRDLSYPDENELYSPYYYPDLPYSDSELYGGYENPYETEALTQNQMNPLEELLEENEEYEQPYSVDQYGEPSWYDYPPLRYEGDDGVYMPVKRQMLSFVPGNRKRSSLFYPVSEEPETHFGAFVPQKRDYFDTYGSLVRAARLLAARQEERQGYPEWI